MKGAENERSAREQLAACYHVFNMLGWTELIFNHITMRIPGTDRFLINPYGLWYDEITPDNLISVDTNGRPVTKTDWPINPAGFLIHSAVHVARNDAHCVMHTHTTAGLAVACSQSGLTLTNFYAALLYGRVGYHDFEGITTEPDEGPRIVRALGNRDLLILRNHGLLACGRDIPSAFYNIWRLERACQIQISAAGLGQQIEIPEAVGEKAAEQTRNFDPEGIQDARIFDALRRRAARLRPDLAWLHPKSHA
ncbi:class II aldolase/adducin family protein [Bradyrhizobium sp. 200]|uniref:class II aldolase/adducin family protein n=1 Tax=Bradyrhizobium sp. 200 TaxID=2782665 RepID=UPI001FFE313D|nr:class II aldolase/adducin family protein [Bradyrhizobium sp. 200]UPJ50132.1 class II aldolase/adducin family protein [Bradyrhizobium sp. 200]